LKLGQRGRAEPLLRQAYATLEKQKLAQPWLVSRAAATLAVARSR